MALLPLVAAPGAGSGAFLEGESVFAVVTRKAGFASGLAHDHLVIASRPDVDLHIDPSQPTAARFTLATRVEDLRIDHPGDQERWASRLSELGLVDSPLSEIKEKNRRKIRRSMLDEGQLDATNHPSLEARLLRVEEKETRVGEVELPFALRVEMTVRGVRVEKTCGGRRGATEATFEVEAVCAFLFTDFGIEPYSAFLGAVKNADRFFVYARVVH